MAKIDQRLIALGDAKRISGADDRGHEIEQTLERVKEERIAAAEREAQRLLGQARQQAEHILEQARQIAQNLEQDAEQRRDEVLRQASQAGEEAGFKKGLEDGRLQAQQETERLLQSAQIVTQGAYEAKKLVLESFQPQACEILQAVAQRVVADELAARPQQLLALIQRAVNDLDVSGRVRVVMNRDALRELRAHGDVVSDALESLTRLTLEGDALLDPHEIYALYEEGGFDLSPDSQIAQYVEALAPTLNLTEPDDDGT